jgi:hypothetical protein
MTPEVQLSKTVIFLTSPTTFPGLDSSHATLSQITHSKSNHLTSNTWDGSFTPDTGGSHL